MASTLNRNKRKSSSTRKSTIRVRKSNSYELNNNLLQTTSVTVQFSSCCTTDAANPYCNNKANKRAVFLDLLCFHQYWRLIPSNVISDCILILPNIYTEWILKPSKYIKLNQIPKDSLHILSDHVFIRLLQWKHTQGLLYCMLNRINTVLSWNLSDSQLAQSKVAPFWHHLNDSLCQITDPSRDNKHYNALHFDGKYYKNIKSKYGVTTKQILSELQTLKTMTVNVISEILFQSNPSLNIIKSYFDLKRNILLLKQQDLQKDANASCLLTEADDVDVDALLNNIFAMYTVSVNEEVVAASDTSLEMDIDSKTDDDDDDDDGYWFAEDYENYDGFQDITH